MTSDVGRRISRQCFGFAGSFPVIVRRCRNSRRRWRLCCSTHRYQPIALWLGLLISGPLLFIEYGLPAWEAFERSASARLASYPPGIHTYKQFRITPDSHESIAIGTCPGSDCIKFEPGEQSHRYGMDGIEFALSGPGWWTFSKLENSAAMTVYISNLALGGQRIGKPDGIATLYWLPIKQGHQGELWTPTRRVLITVDDDSRNNTLLSIGVYSVAPGTPPPMANTCDDLCTLGYGRRWTYSRSPKPTLMCRTP